MWRVLHYFGYCSKIRLLSILFPKVNEMKLFLILYADDQVLFSISPDSLQSMLADIEAYCDKWGLKMDTNKVLIFEKGSRYTDRSFYLLI